MKRDVLGRSLDLVAAVLRLVFVLAIVVAFGRIAAAQANDAPTRIADFFGSSSVSLSDANDDNAKMVEVFKSIDISCDTFVVFDFQGSDWQSEKRKVEQLNFDNGECHSKLDGKSSNTLLQPLWEELELGFRNNIGVSPTEASENASRLIMQQTIERIQKNFSDLYDLCASVKPARNRNDSRVCYFGLPMGQGSVTSQSLALGVATNSLPYDQTICAREPLTNSQKVEPEFQAIQNKFQTEVSWSMIENQLEADHFLCDEKLGACMKNVIMMVLQAKPDKVGEPPEFPHERFITMRLLSAYRGDWRAAGGVHKCSSLSQTDNHPYCAETVERGDDNGICFDNTQLEGTGMFSVFLNGPVP
jgi:hypothetical protein